MMEQHHAPLTKEILAEALLGLEERLDAQWDLKLDSKLQRFATKDDLQPFATKDDLQSFATKDDLKSFATKDDLKPFATKDDLKPFATKDDLKPFATKDDLKSFATKDDLKPFATKDDLKPFATKDDLKPFATKDALRTVQVAVARLEGEMHDVKHILRTEVATKRDLEPILRFAERALKEMDEHRELRSTRGALLNDVADKVEDHERRLRGIEGRS